MASEKMQAFLDGLKNQPPKKADLGPIEKQRAYMDDFMSSQPVPDKVGIEDSVLANRPARRYTPQGKLSEGGILYLHGGGYRVGSLNSHNAFMAHLAAACNAMVIGLDYRLAPENPYPAALDDAVAAFVGVTQSVAAGKTMIAGDSAGGGLALACALRLKDEGLPTPGCLALLSPATDLTCSGESLGSNRDQFAKGVAAYVGDHPPDTIGLSPLFGDMAGLPPLLIQVVSDESLVDDSTRLEKRARDAGVSVDLRFFDEAFHVFQIFTEFPESQDALSDIGRFYERHIQ
jgi:acetyl esterase/lipase